MSKPYATHPIAVRFPEAFRLLPPIGWYDWVHSNQPSAITAEFLMECFAWEFADNNRNPACSTPGEGFFYEYLINIDYKAFVLSLAKQPWFQNVGLQRLLKKTEFLRHVYQNQIVSAITVLGKQTVLDVLWFTNWRDVLDEDTLRLMAVDAMKRAFSNVDVRREAMQSCIKASAKTFLGEFHDAFMPMIAKDEPTLILLNFAVLETMLGKETTDLLATTAVGNIPPNILAMETAQYEWSRLKLYRTIPITHLIPFLKSIDFLTEDGKVITSAYELLGFTAQQYPDNTDVAHVVQTILNNMEFDWAPTAALAFLTGLNAEKEIEWHKKDRAAWRLCKETRYGRMLMTALQRAGWAATELMLEDGPQGPQLQTLYRYNGETIVFVIPSRLYRDYSGKIVLYPTTPPERSTFRNGNVRGYITALPIFTFE